MAVLVVLVEVLVRLHGQFPVQQLGLPLPLLLFLDLQDELIRVRHFSLLALLGTDLPVRFVGLDLEVLVNQGLLKNVSAVSDRQTLSRGLGCRFLFCLVGAWFVSAEDGVVGERGSTLNQHFSSLLQWGLGSLLGPRLLLLSGARLCALGQNRVAGRLYNLLRLGRRRPVALCGLLRGSVLRVLSPEHYLIKRRPVLVRRQVTFYRHL